MKNPLYPVIDQDGSAMSQCPTAECPLGFRLDHGLGIGRYIPIHHTVIGGAFRKKLVGRNGSLGGGSGM